MENTCNNCQKIYSSKDKGSKFCSRSCAAQTNNKLFKKRKREGSCKSCSEIINSSRTYCIFCLEKRNQTGKQTKQKPKNKVSKNKPLSNSQRVIGWRQRVKVKAIEYKGGNCQLCGYNKCVRSLQFHHLDPSQKDFSISGKSISWERIKNELDKCILICANCHGEEHDKLDHLITYFTT